MIDKTRARIWVFFLKILVIIKLPKKPKEKTTRADHQGFKINDKTIEPIKLNIPRIPTQLGFDNANFSPIGHPLLSATPSYETIIKPLKQHRNNIMNFVKSNIVFSLMECET